MGLAFGLFKCTINLPKSYGPCFSRHAPVTMSAMPYRYRVEDFACQMLINEADI